LFFLDDILMVLVVLGVLLDLPEEVETLPPLAL
jgi:hypothetical protein